MKIVPISAFKDNYIWAILPENSQCIICVDPGESLPVLQFLEENRLKLAAILLTHHHDDHIGGVPKLHALFPQVPIYGPLDKRIPLITHPLQDGDTIDLFSLHFEVINTPGHTSTHISLYESTQKLLFCGDTLFSAGCGRVFDGTIQQLHQSLQRLKQLPAETNIFCAHEYTLQNLRFASSVEPNNPVINDYLFRLNHQRLPFCTLPSTLALEKEINPFLRTDNPDVRQYVQHNGGDTHDSLSVLKKLRLDKNNFA